jgi:hypothetical protein
MASRAFTAIVLVFLLSGCRKTAIAGIEFRKIANGRSDARRYFHIHGNETTARDVLVEHMKSHKGTAYIIKSTKRNVPVGAVEIDPNRMFSTPGARQSVYRLNPMAPEAYTQNATHYLLRDRLRFFDKILPKPGGLLIVLHNNTAGYSVNDELEGSDANSLKDKEHPHEFMLTTQRQDYDILKNSPFNVVLQTEAEPDDGSLSRRCARMGVRYINIEAGQGQHDRQKAMLDWIEQHLP